MEGRLNESRVKCQMRVCARVFFHFHYCFRLFPLTVCLSRSRFAIITFINYESGAPDERGEARCRRRSSQAAQRPCTLRSRLREAAHFYFSFIHSGRFTGTAKKRSGRMEGGSCRGDREIRSGVFYNYPTLLAVMIILLRVLDLFAPWPCPLLPFRMQSDDFIKIQLFFFPGSRHEWHATCTSASRQVTFSLAHRQNNISRVRFRGSECRKEV